jgi:hypothetical protein
MPSGRGLIKRRAGPFTDQSEFTPVPERRGASTTDRIPASATFAGFDVPCGRKPSFEGGPPGRVLVEGDAELLVPLLVDVNREC